MIRTIREIQIAASIEGDALRGVERRIEGATAIAVITESTAGDRRDFPGSRVDAADTTARRLADIDIAARVGRDTENLPEGRIECASVRQRLAERSVAGNRSDQAARQIELAKHRVHVRTVGGVREIQLPIAIGELRDPTVEACAERRHAVERRDRIGNRITATSDGGDDAIRRGDTADPAIGTDVQVLLLIESESPRQCESRCGRLTAIA